MPIYRIYSSSSQCLFAPAYTLLPQRILFAVTFEPSNIPYTKFRFKIIWKLREASPHKLSYDLIISSESLVCTHSQTVVPRRAASVTTRGSLEKQIPDLWVSHLCYKGLWKILMHIENWAHSELEVYAHPKLLMLTLSYRYVSYSYPMTCYLRTLLFCSWS